MRMAGTPLLLRRRSQRHPKIGPSRLDAGTVSGSAQVGQSGRGRNPYFCSRWRNHLSSHTDVFLNCTSSALSASCGASSWSSFLSAGLLEKRLNVFQYIFFTGREDVFVCEVSVSRKASRRSGCFLHAVLRILLSFWSSEGAYK